MATTFVIFGASGDLTSRKLVPALYQLFLKKRLPEQTSIVGVSRTPFSDEEFRNHLVEHAQEHSEGTFTHESWDAFAPRVHYKSCDMTKSADMDDLAKYLDNLEGSSKSDRVYYLSTAPRYYAPAVTELGRSGMAKECDGCRRMVVIEKPFGTDLKSAHDLNEHIHTVFSEHQVYRIDHYLGKETVQNLLVLRFANTIFEPIWNRQYIDNIQITAAEEVKVGHRAGYYDSAGIMRDMFQNHLLQLLMVTAMEAPLRFEADAVRNEKVKVLQAIRPLTPEEVARDTIRGRYKGYLDEPDVPSDSQTATFAAIKLRVDNWRWQGVPFYLRSGKAMDCRSTQIVVTFREPPHMMFNTASIDRNQLVIQIQPAEGIQLYFQNKVPDAGMKLRTQELDFRFRKQYENPLPEAYQRLLLDCIQGDASLFARSDEVELAWGIIDPILAAWRDTNRPELLEYDSGYWGPIESTEWMQAQRREWYDMCPVLE
jgi:glucose-6-phosphate 1-dehydrogenase